MSRFPSADFPELFRGKTVFSSFSGGADSLALLLFLEELRQQVPFSLYAVHFEHGFRGAASLADAEFCRNFCAERRIPFRMFPLNAPANRLPGEGDEACARRLRLASWEKIITDPENSFVALGHHADDRMENVFLRLFRGANASGLSSMRPVQQIGKLRFVRPFLNRTRKELELFLSARGITGWCTDETNHQSEYKRNLLRLELIPAIEAAFPFAKRGILRSIQALDDDSDYLEQSAAAAYEKMGSNASPEQWRKLHPAVRIRVLRLFLREKSGGDLVPDVHLAERFNRDLFRPVFRLCRIPVPGKSFELVLSEKHLDLVPLHQERLQKCLWDFHQERILACGTFRISAGIISPEKIQYPADASEAFFDLAEVPEQIEAGPRLRGEKMIPFGHTGEVPLKKIFIDKGISMQNRGKYPVLRMNGRCVWIPFVRNGAFASVTEKTKKVLHLVALQENLKNQG